jgi:hypothetical protein
LKTPRAIILISGFVATILIANLLAFSTQGSRYTLSYPDLICPQVNTGQVGFISLDSSKIKIRKTGTSDLKYKKARIIRLSASQQATIVEGSEITPVSWVAQQNVWAGAVSCISPITTQWFVGGSADVTAKGSLTLVNSGLGKALIEVTPYTEDGAQAVRLIQVKANAISKVSLSSISPGSKYLALKVNVLTGRVNAFMTDVRGRGLTALGGDVVNGQSSASKSIVIPAIPHQKIGKNSLGHFLRILVPGQVEAHIKATIVSSDGSFAPMGIDGLTISGGKVVSKELKAVLSEGKFALHITSDRPIVASLFSYTFAQGKKDFVWTTPTLELKKMKFSVTGLKPTFVFSGKNFKVELDVTNSRGKVRRVKLSAEEIKTYAVPDGTRSIEIVKTSSQVFAGALISSKSGYGYFPAIQGSELTKTSIPHSNLRVLIP